MAVRVNRGALLQSLSQAEAGLSNTYFIAQSKCFVFTNGWAVTFNDEVCVRAKTPLPAEWSGAVRAKPLKSVLESLADDEVEVDATDRVFSVRAHRVSVDLRLESEVVLPVDSVEAPDAWLPLPEGFGRAVEQVCAAAGSNEEEFLTVVVHFHPDYIEATDRIQIVRCRVATGLSGEFLARAKSLAKVVPLGVDRVGETPNWLHFRRKGVVFSVRRTMGLYPDVTRMLEFPASPAVLPQGAVQAAKLGGILTADDKENNKVLVRLRPGYMEVVGEGAHGRCKVLLDTTYDGEEIAFRVSPALLVRIVQEYSECEVGKDRLRVRGDGWVYMALFDAASPAPAVEPRAEEEEEASGEPVDTAG